MKTAGSAVRGVIGRAVAVEVVVATATADPAQAVTERIGVRVVTAQMALTGSSVSSISRRSRSRARNCERR